MSNEHCTNILKSGCRDNQISEEDFFVEFWGCAYPTEARPAAVRDVTEGVTEIPTSRPAPPARPPGGIPASGSSSGT